MVSFRSVCLRLLHTTSLTSSDFAAYSPGLPCICGVRSMDFLAGMTRLEWRPPHLLSNDLFSQSFIVLVPAVWKPLCSIQAVASAVTCHGGCLHAFMAAPISLERCISIVYSRDLTTQCIFISFLWEITSILQRVVRRYDSGTAKQTTCFNARRSGHSPGKKKLKKREGQQTKMAVDPSDNCEI